MADRRRPNRLWRWLVRGLIILVVLVAVALSTLFFLARSAKTRWEQSVAELRASGEPLTYSDLEALQAPIPDDQNGARVIERAAAALKATDKPPAIGVLLLDRLPDTGLSQAIPHDRVEASRRFFDARKGAYEELAKLVDLPDARFDIPYTGVLSENSSRIIDLFSALRSLARLAGVRGALAVIDGDRASAVEALRIRLQLSGAVTREPSHLLQLATFGNDALTATQLEGLLHIGELDEQTLLGLQREWEHHLPLRTMKWALRGERASVIQMTDRTAIEAELKAAATRFPDIAGDLGSRPRLHSTIPFLDDWVLLANRVQSAAVLTRLIEVADDPVELLTVARREQAALPRFSPGCTSIKILLPSLTRGIELRARSLAFFRCAPVLLAAERFRMDTGRLPASLDELIPAYLAQKPEDPFDGRALRLATSDEGIVVYSIGENRVDDGGSVTPVQGERLGRDFGLRLLRPERRGLVILPIDPDDPEGRNAATPGAGP